MEFTVQFGSLKNGAVFYVANAAWVKRGRRWAAIAKSGSIGSMRLNPDVAAIFNLSDEVLI